MDRKEAALTRINIAKGTGLELGPLYSPIVLKKEAKIFYLDHMSADDLRKKYKGHPIPLDEIVDVDFVLKNNSLKESVGGNKFDYIIASHVIEHIPDMISWFADMSSILNDGGIVSLVIPDKRFTFDIKRNVSRPADVIGAYLDKHTKADSATIYDYFSEFRNNIIAHNVWNNPHVNYGKKPQLTQKEAYEFCLENLLPDKYVDSHCFVFTPYSFFEIVKAVIGHNLFDFEVDYFMDTPENLLEFYVSFRKVKKSTNEKKLRSIPKITRPKGVIDLNIEVAKQASEIQGLKAELHNLINSKSWKITKPLRDVRTSIKRPNIKGNR
jgi:SAM-dependent methyltransferase